MKDTYTPKSLVIKLDSKTSKRIHDFWEENGCFKASMVGQPVKRGRGYTLKLRMFSPSQSAQLDDLISELRKEQDDETKKGNARPK